MSSNRRQIRLTYVNTSESVIAEMLDDETPQVCDFVWSILPVEKKVIHGMYSGAEVFAMIDNPQPAPAKTWCSFRCPASCSTSTTPASARWARRNRSERSASSTGAGLCFARMKACRRIAPVRENPRRLEIRLAAVRPGVSQGAMGGATVVADRASGVNALKHKMRKRITNLHQSTRISTNQFLFFS